LALNWDSDFTADQATLHVDEYLDIYKEQSKGSVLIMDEAEQVDARRSMSNQNVEFSEKWSMMRYSEVDSILTLPTVTALDKRVEELADVWINVIERGYAKCNLINVHDRKKTVENLPWHSLSWPDISHLSVAKKLERKKERKIAGEIYGNDTAEEDNKEQEKQYQLRLAQRLRNKGKTLREIADDEEIDYSYQWVNQHTEKPD
jgi:Zonular occludens toxin (Zot).